MLCELTRDPLILEFRTVLFIHHLFAIILWDICLIKWYYLFSYVYIGIPSFMHSFQFLYQHLAEFSHLDVGILSKYILYTLLKIQQFSLHSCGFVYVLCYKSKCSDLAKCYLEKIIFSSSMMSSISTFSLSFLVL